MRHLLGGDQAKLAGMSESAGLAEPVVFFSIKFNGHSILSG